MENERQEHGTVGTAKRIVCYENIVNGRKLYVFYRVDEEGWLWYCVKQKPVRPNIWSMISNDGRDDPDESFSLFCKSAERQGWRMVDVQPYTDETEWADVDEEFESSRTIEECDL